MSIVAGADFETVSVRVELPDEREAAMYDRLYSLFCDAHFAFEPSNAHAAQPGHILPALRQIAGRTQRQEGT